VELPGRQAQPSAIMEELAATAASVEPSQQRQVHFDLVRHVQPQYFGRYNGNS